MKPAGLAYSLNALDPLGALQQAASPHRPARSRLPQHLLVAGAGGALGRAVLHQALAGGRHASVGVLTIAPLQTGMRGLVAVPHDAAAQTPLRADIAVIVFDRGRDFYGRDEAYHLPVPAELPALAQRLRAGGVHTLAVVCPTAPSLLPAALQQGLADLDEHAVAALGFERLLFVRPTQDAPKKTITHRAERLAAWMLSQLRYMIPSTERPVRAESVAAFVFEVLRQWPEVPGSEGTRVAGAPMIWAAAQGGGAKEVVTRWLETSGHRDESV